MGGDRFEHLDFRPLERGPGLRARLRTIARTPRFVIGGTVAVLLLAAPGVALIVLLVMAATGVKVGLGLLAGLALLTAGGLYVVYDVLHQAGDGSALERFAEVNGLQHLTGRTATHYRGSRFADGSHLVDAAVRADAQPVVEVGDAFPVVSAGSEPELRTRTGYLRVQVAGAFPVGSDSATAVVDPGLAKELTALLGPVEVEVGWREVTVYGTRDLGVSGKGRVREALRLADRLATAADALAGPARTQRGPSGVTIPPPRETASAAGPGLHPVVLVLGTLAALVVLPVLVAVVMSSLESVTRGNELVATLVVGVLVSVLLGIVFLLVRVASTHGRGSGRGRRR